MRKEVTTTDQLGRLINLAAEAIGLTHEGKRTPAEVSGIVQALQMFKEQKPIFVPADDLKNKLLEWERFYKKHFNRTINLSTLVIPPKQEGFNRLLVIAEGITTDQAYDACTKEFSVWRYADDLDKAVPTNDRMPTKTYAIWVRDRIEADEELKNLSVDTLKNRGITGETLLERLIHELKYYDETGTHLDIKNWTLCSGSRSTDGSVPGVYWCGDRLEVSWHSSDNAYGYLRARQVVS